MSFFIFVDVFKKLIIFFIIMLIYNSINYELILYETFFCHDIISCKCTKTL